MTMKRKVYAELLQWKQGKGESALLIEGARRVGKTFIAEEFGRNEYKSYIVVDFTNDDVINAFEQYHSDFDLLFSSLSAIYSTKLYEMESLIIFDEIQNYLRARQLIKHLVKDRRYDYIETGSLVSIMTKSSTILIPSEEDRVEMYPMDFEEFLWAMGEDQALEMIRECFERRSPVGEAGLRTGRSRQETHPGPVQGGYRKVARREHQPCPQHIRPHPGRTEQKGQGVHTVHHRQEREDEGVRRFVHVACGRPHR